ncbi:MAG: hypothetical protein AAF667_12285 [Pseudomonadota bacterium]
MPRIYSSDLLDEMHLAGTAGLKSDFGRKRPVSLAMGLLHRVVLGRPDGGFGK